MNKKNTVIAQKLLKTEWELAQKKGIKWKDFIKDYQAHHIIPKELLNTSEGLQFYFNNGGKLKFNSIDNGIMLKKSVIHGNHPDYNKLILNKIDDAYYKIYKMEISNDLKLKIFKEQLYQLIKKTRKEIISKSINGGKKINNLYKP